MAPQKHFIFLLLSVLATTVISHKLLVFSFTGSKSHMISQGRIADTLAEAGHNVTLLSFEFTIPTDEFPHTKYARVIRMGSVDPDILASMSSKKAVFLEAVFMPKSGIAHLWNAYKTYKAFTTTIPALHEKTLINEKALIEQLRAENFDAIFVEQLFPFGTALGQALGIRTHFIVNSCPLQEHLIQLEYL
ncbi:UDP-glucoronosyl and UDP-glucosyl transferase domain-containing protein [Ditylenchus destructor]|nr:UDP-glucoronosyl and UDP-glucosyl transferase domain-containing protein [Ditylenchus destructor]